MDNQGQPVAVVLDDMCRECGGDEMGQHEQHEYEAFPRPPLPAGVDIHFERTTWLEDKSLRARVRGRVSRPGAPDLGAAAWLWSAGDDDQALDCEWDLLQQAVRVQLARLLCPHVDLHVFAGVARIVADGALAVDALPPATGYQADIRVWCADCGEPFVFVGDQLQVGMRPDMPTVDVAGTTLAAPLRPRSTPEGWGRDRPGFAVRTRR